MTEIHWQKLLESGPLVTDNLSKMNVFVCPFVTTEDLMMVARQIGSHRKWDILERLIYNLCYIMHTSINT